MDLFFFFLSLRGQLSLHRIAIVFICRGWVRLERVNFITGLGLIAHRRFLPLCPRFGGTSGNQRRDRNLHFFVSSMRAWNLTSGNLDEGRKGVNTFRFRRSSLKKSRGEPLSCSARSVWFVVSGVAAATRDTVTKKREEGVV